MRVVVTGAGLAGLALANGLAGAGHDVTVLEADQEANARPQGYRIHLDGRGLRALEGLLPAEYYRLVEQTCGQFAEPRRLQVLTGRLHRIRTIATGPGLVDGRLVSTAADRGTLRAILAHAATANGAQIHWGTTVLGYEESPQQVRAHTAGGVKEADLLVGCDGPRSRIAKQRLPQLVIQDTGADSIVGRSPAGAASTRLSEYLAHGYVVLRGMSGGVGLGLMRFATRPEPAGRAAGVPLDPTSDYVMWNVGLPPDAGPASGGREEWQDHAVRRVRSWHRDVRALIAAADPAQTFLAPVLIAQRPEPWSPSRVTAIGDAVHVMPADRGSGANLALADAARLATALGTPLADGAEAGSGNADAALLAAIGAAEREMVEHAFAVSEAGPTVNQHRSRRRRASS